MDILPACRQGRAGQGRAEAAPFAGVYHHWRDGRAVHAERMRERYSVCSAGLDGMWQQRSVRQGCRVSKGDMARLASPCQAPCHTHDTPLRAGARCRTTPLHAAARGSLLKRTSMISLALSSSPTISLRASSLSSFRLPLSLISSASCSDAQGGGHHVRRRAEGRRSSSRRPAAQLSTRSTHPRALAVVVHSPGQPPARIALRGNRSVHGPARHAPARTGSCRCKS